MSIPCLSGKGGCEHGCEKHCFERVAVDLIRLAKLVNRLEDDRQIDGCGLTHLELNAMERGLELEKEFLEKAGET